MKASEAKETSEAFLKIVGAESFGLFVFALQNHDNWTWRLAVARGHRRKAHELFRSGDLESARKHMFAAALLRSFDNPRPNCQWPKTIREQIEREKGVFGK